jgi:cytoskeletal protein RodZ
MWERLVLKYGLPKLIGAGVVLSIALIFGGILGWSKMQAWWYKGKAQRLEQKLEVSKQETKVARKDEAQVAGASKITNETVTAQDAHADSTRRVVSVASEVIDERIRQKPVAPAAVIADDPVVRSAAHQAHTRAQAAADRLQGTPSR